MLHRKQLAGPARSALNLIGNQNNAVLVADLANPFQEARRNGNKARLALHRLDQKRSHGGRIDLGNHGVVQLLNRIVDVLLLGKPCRGTIQIGERKPHNLRREGPEAGLEQAVLAGQAKRQQRAPVISALEADDGRAARELARQLDGILHALRAAVGQQRLFLEVSRRNLVQQLGQGEHGLIGRNQRAGMNAALRLPLDRFHHRRGRMAHSQHSNSAGQVDQRVAVNVVDQRALGAIHHDLGGAAQPRGKSRGAPRQSGPRIGPRNLGFKMNIRHSILP